MQRDGNVQRQAPLMTAGLLNSPGTRGTTSGSGFRADVEGLRAVAVGLVLLYHAGLPFVPGGFVGVDVFFVISGFLITGMLVREVQESGRVSLSRFYARRAKRLLPAAALVLVVTAVITRLFVPIVDWRAFGGDIVASAMYLVNWRLADRSVDYLAEDVGASPVQHFWSLAVEEQFYIVWPVLLVLVAWWVRRSGWSVRRTMALALALVALPSLAWSVVATSASPERAFFVTTTRLWELAVGAAVAIAAPRLAQMTRYSAVPLAWAGLAAIVLAGLFVTTATPWPGYFALLPTMGTAAVIGAGVAAGRFGPVVILGKSAFQWIGKLSYSLYLWHWPLITVALAYWSELSVAAATVVIALSFVPAWLAFRLVEEPVRRRRSLLVSPRTALVMGAMLSVVGATAGVGLFASTPSISPAPISAPGAAILSEDPEGDTAGVPADVVTAMTPQPTEATRDIPDAYGRGCQVDQVSSVVRKCDYGDPDGAVKVALVGDSKALQWISALDTVGQHRGWSITTMTKSGCSFADATVPNGETVYESCTAWNQNVLEALLADPPDVVVTSQGRATAIQGYDDREPRLSADAMIDGLVSRWATLEQAGIEVVVLADNPQPGVNVYECVAENLERLTSCAFSRDTAVEKSAAVTQRRAVEQARNVTWVDLTAAVCPTPECAPVIGNVLIYRQGSHITRTYIDSLAPRLEAALVPLIEES